MFILSSGGSAFETVDAAEAAALLTKQNAIALDVRSPDEFKKERIEGAWLLWVEELEKKWTDLPKDKAFLVYCTLGVRSRRACRFLEKKGFRNLYNLEGGIEAWKKAGYSIIPGSGSSGFSNP